jgi:hypothetical protein
MSRIIIITKLGAIRCPCGSLAALSDMAAAGAYLT